MTIHSSGQIVFGFSQIEGVTLGTGEDIDEVARGATGMGMDRIGEVGDRTSEGQAAAVNGTEFTVGSLAMVGIINRMQGQGSRLV